jgi:2',3'-cyclic-nucleotide 2'-phosphodiesterase (5'-nucleotidase family)
MSTNYTDCQQCDKIDAVYFKYAPGLEKYEQRIAETEMTYTCDRTHPEVFQTEVVFFFEKCYHFQASLITYIIYSEVSKSSAVDVVIFNRDSIRTELLEGDISYKNIFNVIPFYNYLLITKITGAKLRELLNYNLKNSKEHGHLQLYGVTVAYNDYLDVVSIFDLNGDEINEAKEYKFDCFLF